MHETYSAFFIIGVAFLLAGFVKGMIGMGLPTVSIGLLALVMTPAQANAVLIFPSLLTNGWQALAGGNFLKFLRRMWLFLIGICLGIWSGYGLMTGPNVGFATSALGVILIIYSLFSLFSVKFSVSPRTEKWLSPVIGLMTGVVGAATGVFSVPAIPYLQSLGMKRDELIQALGIFFSVASFALSVNLIRDGSLRFSVATASIVAFIAASAGMYIGTWVRARVPAETFRICFLVGLMLLGAHLVSRGMF